MTDLGRVCPICGRTYKERPALSRLDNQTEICPDCGTKQAIADFNMAVYKRRKFRPEVGKTYRNEGGGQYRCMRTSDTPTMRNMASGWTFEAHGVGIYPDNSIDWDYSTGGRFE